MSRKNFSHAVRYCTALVLILISSSLFAQKKVSSTVFGAKDNQPVSGATVLVKGTTTGVTTATNSTFSINVPAGNNTLIVSYIGFTEQEVDVSNSTNVNVTLRESTSNLNEIVVTGYTAQKKKDITGAVSVVNMNELKAQPTASPVEALQGKAAGVQIINDGALGSTPQIRIRGFSTINNNDPLYVIDGMPYQGKLSWFQLS